jgi:hypothetical protein
MLDDETALVEDDISVSGHKRCIVVSYSTDQQEKWRDEKEKQTYFTQEFCTYPN